MWWGNWGSTFPVQAAKEKSPWVFRFILLFISALKCCGINKHEHPMSHQPSQLEIHDWKPKKCFKGFDRPLLLQMQKAKCVCMCVRARMCMCAHERESTVFWFLLCVFLFLKRKSVRRLFEVWGPAMEGNKPCSWICCSCSVLFHTSPIFLCSD